MKTKVVFRKYKDGSVIALFPHEVADAAGNCSSYIHIGQHGAADYLHVMKETKATTPEEYETLRLELISSPYNYDLMVCTRKGKPIKEAQMAEKEGL